MYEIIVCDYLEGIKFFFLMYFVSFKLVGKIWWLIVWKNLIIEWEIFVIMDISLVIYVDSYRYVVWIKKYVYIKKIV